MTDFIIIWAGGFIAGLVPGLAARHTLTRRKLAWTRCTACDEGAWIMPTSNMTTRIWACPRCKDTRMARGESRDD